MTYGDPRLLDEMEQSVCRWYRCPICFFANGEPLPDEGGVECRSCGYKSDHVFYLFHYNAHALINLIHDGAFGDLRAYGDPSDRLHEPSSVHVSILLFFCTLREICLNELLRDMARALAIPPEVISRLESDNRSHSEKIHKLFPSLARLKWKEAIESLSETEGSDFVALDERIRKAVELRNKFVHEGNDWTVNSHVTTQCVADIPEMLQLFVHLNNRYVFARRRNI